MFQRQVSRRACTQRRLECTGQLALIDEPKTKHESKHLVAPFECTSREIERREQMRVSYHPRDRRCLRHRQLMRCLAEIDSACLLHAANVAACHRAEVELMRVDAQQLLGRKQASNYVRCNGGLDLPPERAPWRRDRSDENEGNRRRPATDCSVWCRQKRANGKAGSLSGHRVFRCKDGRTNDGRQESAGLKGEAQRRYFVPDDEPDCRRDDRGGSEDENRGHGDGSPQGFRHTPTVHVRGPMSTRRCPRCHAVANTAGRVDRPALCGLPKWSSPSREMTGGPQL